MSNLNDWQAKGLQIYLEELNKSIQRLQSEKSRVLCLLKKNSCQDQRT